MMPSAVDGGGMADALPGTGGAPAGGAAGAAVPADGGLGGAPGAGGAVAGGAGGSAGTGGVAGTGGAHASGGAVGSGGMGGAGGAGGAVGGPEVLYCPDPTHPSIGGCGFLVSAGQWEYLWKGDMACATCTTSATNVKPVTGCKVTNPPQMTSNPTPAPAVVLCVANCRAECCYKRPGAVCESDANCCSPLRCVASAGGKVKTCQ